MSNIIKPTYSLISYNIKRYITYKSAVSLDNLYSNSNLKLTTPSKPINEGNKFSGYIPIEDLEITYSRSTGPGGQNVNTLNTKVDLRFHVSSAKWINDDIKSKLLQHYKTRINKEGYLVFRSDLTRSQQLNLADCLEKVRTAIRSVDVSKPEVSEETQEKIRKRMEKAVRVRLSEKRDRSLIKASRRESL